MKTIVTGGAGFIGSHLVKRLLDEGDDVIVIDNMHTGNKKNLPVYDNLKVVVADILDYTGYLFKDVDVVYHLAALTRPQESIHDPVLTNIVNVNGTIKVLEHCRKRKVKRIVFVSTTGIYGEQREQPIAETAKPNPMCHYAVTKWAGEKYCKLYNKLYGLEYNIIRPFNVYGEGQNPLGGYAAAVPKFIDTLNRDETPFITGDGTQSRDFVYVKDVVDLIFKAGNSKVKGETFNAGSGMSTSINQIYEMVSKIMKKKIKPDYIDPVFEPPKTWGDILRAERLLDWTPLVKLEKGLNMTIRRTI